MQTPTDLGLDLRVALMPEGRDPADLVQAGEIDQLRAVIDESVPFLSFEIDRVLASHDLSEIEGKTRALREAASRVARLDDEVARREYARLLARQTGLDQDAAISAVEQSRRGAPIEAAPQRPSRTPPKESGSLRAEREALRLVAAGHFAGGGLHVEHFTDATNRRAFELMMEFGAAEGPVDLVRLAEANPKAAEFVRVLIMSDTPEEDAPQLFRRLELGLLDRRIDVVQRELDQLAPDDFVYEERSKDLVGLLQRRQALRAAGAQ